MSDNWKATLPEDAEASFGLPLCPNGEALPCDCRAVRIIRAADTPARLECCSRQDLEDVLPFVGTIALAHPERDDDGEEINYRRFHGHSVVEVAMAIGFRRHWIGKEAILEFGDAAMGDSLLTDTEDEMERARR
jgi:hypothetical protein